MIVRRLRYATAHFAQAAFVFMNRIVISAAKFVIFMFVMTIVCSIVWDTFVYGRLYYCSDPLWDYVHPGNWVHNVDGYPVAVVNHVVAGPTNGIDRDTIKAGWNTTRLWHLWFSFVGISMVASILLSWVRWISREDLVRHQ